MSLTLDQLTNGLTPEHDYYFAERPADPEMRESTSIWLYEENGEFAFPRIGIEAEAHSWDNRLYHANFNLGGGRALHGAGRGPVPLPIGKDGKASVFGAGPLTFYTLEPFRKTRVVYDGAAADGTAQQMLNSTFDHNNQVPIKLDVELTMVTPAWVQDNSPDKVAKLNERDRIAAANMGIGWRFEHLFRGEGELTIDGKTRHFKCVGNRIKRQSVRPLAGFSGHIWQAAVFPDGRAFASLAYPPHADGTTNHNDAVIFQNGKMHPAKLTKAPFLNRLLEEGDDMSLELESALGITKISGVSCLNTFRIGGGGIKELEEFNMNQGGARYTWDGQTAYGMVERSSMNSQMEARLKSGNPKP